MADSNSVLKDDEDFKKFWAYVMAKLDTKYDLSILSENSRKVNEEPLAKLATDLKALLETPKTKFKINRQTSLYKANSKFILEGTETDKVKMNKNHIYSLKEIDGDIQEGAFTAGAYKLYSTANSMEKLTDYSDQQQTLTTIANDAKTIVAALPTYNFNIKGVGSDGLHLAHFLQHHSYIAGGKDHFKARKNDKNNFDFSFQPKAIANTHELIASTTISESDRERFDSIVFSIAEARQDGRKMLESGMNQDEASAERGRAHHATMREADAIRKTLSDDPDFQEQFGIALEAYTVAHQRHQLLDTAESGTELAKSKDELLSVIAQAVQANKADIRSIFGGMDRG